MYADLLQLLRLQDLDLLMEAFADPQRRKLERSLGFKLGDPRVLRKEREALAATIHQTLLDRYEQLRCRHSRAVVLVLDGICRGCFVRCPARLVGLPRAIAETCESCGRILVVPHHRGPRAQGTSFGSASRRAQRLRSGH